MSGCTVQRLEAPGLTFLKVSGTVDETFSASQGVRAPFIASVPALNNKLVAISQAEGPLEPEVGFGGGEGRSGPPVFSGPLTVTWVATTKPATAANPVLFQGCSWVQGRGSAKLKRLRAAARTALTRADLAIFSSKARSSPSVRGGGPFQGVDPVFLFLSLELSFIFLKFFI